MSSGCNPDWVPQCPLLTCAYSHMVRESWLMPRRVLLSRFLCQAVLEKVANPWSSHLVLLQTPADEEEHRDSASEGSCKAQRGQAPAQVPPLSLYLPVLLYRLLADNVTVVYRCGTTWP